ncbi:MAG: diguanylate cyclase [Pseudomonadota bacterium]
MDTILPGSALLLLVDNNPDNLDLLAGIFGQEYEVCLAASGVEALAFCRARQPDLILLDVVMPGMDGYMVCEQLKRESHTRDIPIIFITARGSRRDEARAFDMGGIDFITKPFHLGVTRARVRAHIALKMQSDQLRLLAMLDGLTGLGNRRCFDEALRLGWRRCARAAVPLALVMIDVDHFKLFNDLYGHPAGDACLQQVATTLRACVSRPEDLVARYGGEEFVCLLPGATPASAQRIAVKLEQAVRDLAIAHGNSSVGAVVTVSLGVAGAQPASGGDAAALIAAADAQLYRAKRDGRGQVAT